jgi:O-antigen/teichoic acid export membrane protein
MAAIRNWLQGPALFTLIRVLGAGAGFISHIILAHALTPHDLGILFSVTSLVAVGALIASQGYPEIAIRFVTRYRDKGRQLSGRFIGQSLQDSALVALLLTIMLLTWSFIWPSISIEARYSTAIASLSLLALTLLNINSSLAGAMRMFWICYVPETLIRPAMFLALVSGLVLIQASLTAIKITFTYVVLTAGIALGQWIVLRRSLPIVPKRCAADQKLGKHWRAEGRPLVLIAIATTLFADIAILVSTPLLAPADVAVFGICLKLALLIGFVTQVSHHVAAAEFATASRTQCKTAARQVLYRSLYLPVAVTCVAVLVSWWAGATMLQLFGPQFTYGRDALLILLIAQVLRSLGGPSVQLITLAGSQKLNSGICAVSLFVLLVANVLLTPTFGILGAAIAVLLTYLTWLVLAGWALHWVAEMRTDIFAPMVSNKHAAHFRINAEG